jgi:flagellar basal body-associated protein FliL
MKKTNGFAHILLLLVFVAVAVGVVGYYAIKQKSSLNTAVDTTGIVNASPVPSISPSTDINTIQEEFNETNVESVDGEFSSMSAQVKAL